jgi:CRP-like cAMP-binding protein
VDVRKDGAGVEDRLVASIGAGDFFGERVLIVDEPRNATCIAGSGRVEVLALGKAGFRHAMATSASFKDQLHAICLLRQ